MSQETFEQKLKRLKGQYEKDKTELAKAEGSLESAMERLKNEFKYKSIDEAKEALESMNTQLETMQTSIETILDSLSEVIDGER